MPPLSKALALRPVSAHQTVYGAAGYATEEEAAKAGASAYEGIADVDWCVGGVPHGGYLMSVIVEAGILHQKRDWPVAAKASYEIKKHVDPIHISVHFLQAAARGQRFEVHIHTLRTGRSFDNVIAKLVQVDKKGKPFTTMMVQLIFGDSDPATHPLRTITLVPPHPSARRTPFRTLPWDTKKTPFHNRPYHFSKFVAWSEDETVQARNEDPGLNEHRAGLEWGAWVELLDDGEEVTPAFVAFAVDCFRNLPELLPKEIKKAIGRIWLPTLTMSVEYKAPIPKTSRHSRKVVGLYHCARFMQDPQGRHDAYVEIWSAPSREALTGDGNWREEQVCVAVASQVALTVPIEVNEQKSKVKL